jgi:hydroxyethylthiazole kinase-like uncharacterized protein yjeF
VRGGAGLVTLAVPERIEPAVAARLMKEVMTRPVSDDKPGVFGPRSVKPILNFIAARRVTGVAVGPGLSSSAAARAFVKKLLPRLSVPAVVDADGLNALAGGAFLKKHPPLLLTPHPGEAARLLGWTGRHILQDRRGALKSLCRKTGAVVLLKGDKTLISDGRMVYENRTGNAGLSRGGAGDVLTGLCAALAGQVSGATAAEKLLRAACVAAFVHGLAADIAAAKTTRLGLSLDVLLAHIPAAYRRVFGKSY